MYHHQELENKKILLNQENFHRIQFENDNNVLLNYNELYKIQILNYDLDMFLLLHNKLFVMFHYRYINHPKNQMLLDR